VRTPATARRRAAAAFSFLLAVFALSAATIDSGSLSSVPLRYYAGDEVVVRASVRPEKGEKLEELDLKPGSGLPVQAAEADPELRRLKLSKSQEGWSLELDFVPWSPGAGVLPELRRGSFRLPSLQYSALSLLGPEDRDPSPPRPQRGLPGASLILYGLASAFALLVLFALAFRFYLLPAARALIARRKETLAFRRFDESLGYLLREAGAADPSPFFAALLRALRLYLEARVLPGARALTAAELAALPDAAFPAPATRARTAALVALADRCRYGGVAESASARALLESAALEARAIGAANEEALLVRA
jgi:hypothetical protein